MTQTDTQHTPGPRRRIWPWLLVPVLLYGAYEGVMAIIRAHVDNLIEQNHGEQLPAFVLTDQAGQVWSTEKLRGRVVVLNFMRSHCRNCEKEKPEIRRFAEELDSAEVVLLTIVTDSIVGFSPEDTARTIERSQYTHPILLADHALVDSFHGAEWANVTPITYFADDNGTIVVSLRGAQTLETLQDALATAMSSGS